MRPPEPPEQGLKNLDSGHDQVAASGLQTGDLFTLGNLVCEGP